MIDNPKTFLKSLWGHAILVGLVLVIGLVAYSVRSHDLSVLRAKEAETRRQGDVTSRVYTYSLARSLGYSKAQAKRLSDGVILDPKLTLDQIDAKIAEIGEARVSKLLVGPKGKRGAVGGLGRPGKTGKTGPRGISGPSGY